MVTMVQMKIVIEVSSMIEEAPSNPDPMHQPLLKETMADVKTWRI